MKPAAATEIQSFELVQPGEPERIVRGRVESPAAASRSKRSWPHVLVLHGFKGFMDWGFFPELSRRLAGAGFVAVSYNASGSGIGADPESLTEERAFARNTPSRLLEDLALVRAWLEAGSVPWIDLARGAAFGHSMGGGLALLDAARRGDCAALVAWSAISTFERHDEATRDLWRSQGYLPVTNARTGQVLRLDRTWLDDVEARRDALDVRAACARLRTPTLLVHGQDDESVPFAEALELEARFPPGVARLLSVAGAGHTFGARHPLREVPPTLERVLGATLRHFSESIR